MSASPTASDVIVRRFLQSAWILLILGAASGSAVAKPLLPKLSYFDRLALTNWKQVMRVDKSATFWKPTGMLLIAASPDKVMNTFMDFTSYPSFMPKVQSCRIVRRVGQQETWALVVLQLPWPVANAWVAVKYRWEKAREGAYHLSWQRHRGSMDRYWGSLSLFPWGDSWTLAVLTMQAVPDAHVTRSRLNGGIVWGTEQLLHHLRAEMDRRRRLGHLVPFRSTAHGGGGTP